MGNVYDSGEFAANMDHSLAFVDAAGFEKRPAESRARGRIRGLGFSTYVEICAFKGSEPAKAVLEEDGTVTPAYRHAIDGAGAPHRLCAVRGRSARHRLRAYPGYPGRFRRASSGGGTGGSRSIPLGAPSVDRASRLLADQIKSLAADELEAGAGDIELIDGNARVVGTDRSLSFADAARRAKDRSKLIAIGEFNSEADLPERDACLRSGDRPRYRTHGGRPLFERRRFWCHREPDAARRPGARRRGTDRSVRR